ncbi:uncharacterized protein LOC34621544 [Cyclospora cayetanensis]|uniref:Uncharacterized protein LOC34621544 n=1 Tax=Cyclospora cayetanensis TaxID=88456 RepID=A0A6P6RTZ7_9EIME|nr:uncharacterized protein LOC34621544 [Cyclospora cayetanensis]
MATPIVPQASFDSVTGALSLTPSSRRSILVHDGKRSRHQGTAQSIHFAPREETFLVPEPSQDELPDFDDEEEKERALKAAKELAEAVLLEEDKRGREQVQGASDLGPLHISPLCVPLVAAPIAVASGEAESEFSSLPVDTTETAEMGPSSDTEGEEVRVPEELIGRLSSRQLNSMIERKISRELSLEPSISREHSFRVDKAILSFSTFLIAKSLSKRSGDPKEPVPLTEFLPPSPLVTFDGKLGVECMAFKLDFTDRLNNIVPPFFLRDGEKMDERAQEILKRGISAAKEIDLFGPEDLEFLNHEPSAAHKDLLESC